MSAKTTDVTTRRKFFPLRKEYELKVDKEQGKDHNRHVEGKYQGQLRFHLAENGRDGGRPAQDAAESGDAQRNARQGRAQQTQQEHARNLPEEQESGQHNAQQRKQARPAGDVAEHDQRCLAGHDNPAVLQPDR